MTHMPWSFLGETTKVVVDITRIRTCSCTSTADSNTLFAFRTIERLNVFLIRSTTYVFLVGVDFLSGAVALAAVDGLPMDGPSATLS